MGSLVGDLTEGSFVGIDVAVGAGKVTGATSVSVDSGIIVVIGTGENVGRPVGVGVAVAPEVGVFVDVSTRVGVRVGFGGISTWVQAVRRTDIAKMNGQR